MSNKAQRKNLLIYPSFVARIPVLTDVPLQNFSEKTANAVEGKVCPDRFSAVNRCLFYFSRVPQKDTDSHFCDREDRVKTARNPD